MPSRPWLLGVSYSHNGAACILHGDELVVAVQEERLSGIKRARIRHHEESLAVRYCLDYAGITTGDLDMLVACHFSSANPPPLSLPGSSRPPPRRYATLTHHLGHAYAVFATSGFTDAGVLIVDGQGGPIEHLAPEERAPLVRGRVPGQQLETEVISLYGARDGRIVLLEKHSGEFMPGYVAEPRDRAVRSLARFGSLGGMYSAVAELIFGDPLEAGKVMGLAPFGRPVHPGAAFVTRDDAGAFIYSDELCARYRDLAPWPDNAPLFQDLAASVQVTLEQAILSLAERTRSLSGSARLCYAGGVALNSITNQRLHDAGFDDIFIMPAAEDSGPAIGAAYYGLAQLERRVTSRRRAGDGVGRIYPTEALTRALDTTPGVVEVARGDIVDLVVDRLVAGEILGLLHGGSELGPRALGNRSILCDARSPEAKVRLNARVKHREAFRPFAPAILLEDVDDWFVVDPRSRTSPAMLRVLPFRPGKSELVPAASHVDHTGRVQTVEPDGSMLRRILERYRARTGVPILVNTSFNIAGEPIVESPEDALWCLLATDLDGVVLEDRLITRRDDAAGLLELVPRLTCRCIEVVMPIVEGVVAVRGAPGGPITVVTDTRYGELRVPLHSGDLHLLRLCDGVRTGADLRAAVPSLSDLQLVRRLAFYRRANILALTLASSGGSPRSARP